MKLNNGKNVIFDSDITIANDSNLSGLGETLDQILIKQKDDISELKRNVKFLYQYGGIGTHGGGSGSSGGWKIYATLGPQNQMINNNVINLDGANNYRLKIQIQNVSNISAFNVQYSFKNTTYPQGTDPITELVTLSSSFTLNKEIYLDINGEVVVTVTSEDGETKQVQASYVTNPYSFVLNFGNNQENIYTESNPNFFISDIIRDGLYGYLDYSIGVEGKYSYEYVDFQGNKVDWQIIDTSQNKEGRITIPLVQDYNEFFIDDNGGFYTLEVKIKVERDGYQNVEVPRVITCNLIPLNLYLRISPTIEDAVLYNDKITEGTYYEYPLGQNTFIVQAFEGSNKGKYYTLNYSILPLQEGSNPITGSKIIQQNVVFELSFSFGISGWNKLHFELISQEDSNNKYIIDKYVYVSSSAQGLDWAHYTSEVISNKGVNKYKQYRVGISGIDTNDQDTNSNIESDLSLIFPSNILQQSPSVSQKTLTVEPDAYFTPKEFLLNISIQFSSLNKSTDTILKLEDLNNTIEITQESLKVNNDVASIYIPKTDVLDPSKNSAYHLITLYKRYYREVSTQNTIYYEYNIYIDGCLEGVIKKFTTVETQYSSITFNNISYCINLFDLIYYTKYSQGNIFSDAEITRYYYTYLSKYCYIENTDKININNIVQDYFKIDSIEDGLDTGMVSVNSTGLENLGKIASLPMILVLTREDKKTYGDKSASYQDNFLKWYQWRSSAGTGSVSDSSDPTGYLDIGNVRYKPAGESEFRDVQLPKLENVHFRIKKQGTSTKSWFAKNLDLEITSDNELKTYLFSPNLQLVNEDNDSEEIKKQKYNTCLPEQLFTLKKDVVDSAHANNNAVADFVNNNTTKFSTGENNPYIKNCLTGFPCLVFVKTQYTNQETQQPTTHIYYLGYYNFNLGRNSYYNLGYKPLSNITDFLYDPLIEVHQGESEAIVQKTSLKNGFKVYYTTKSQYKPSLMVSEIQNNKSYYDFSQYDKTILFGYNDNDPAMMWGDYEPLSSKLQIQTKIASFVQRIARAGGYIFEYLKKNFGPHDDWYRAVVTDTESDNFGKSKNQVPNYKVQIFKYQDPITGTIKDDGIGDTIPSANINDLKNAVINSIEANTQAVINYTSLVEYYTIAMAFSMVDSVEKNMNIKSWNNGNTWYIAFYDMDTCLGIDNAGFPVVYNAFSDYWDLINQDSSELQPGTVYRDFWPKNTEGSEKTGFDVPSSYLLAIAKYAKLALGDLGDQLTGDFPLSLWAKYRSSTGELKNAEYFINKYYYGRAETIGESLMNYNYRTTYLFKNPEGTINDVYEYSSTDIGKFRGNCKYRTQDWLQKRLRIMDIYMGLLTKNPSLNRRPIQYYDISQDVWKALLDGTGNAIIDLNIDGQLVPNNPDIIIFNDIFDEHGGGQKYNHDINVDIKALENSFIVVTTDDSVKTYMVLDPNKLYNFHPTKYIPISNLMLFGGSDRWTHISDISQFIVSNKLTVKSSNLQDFIMLPSLYTGVTIGGKMPSVKDINISGYNYDFKLEFNNSDDIFTGVLNINISESGVDLEINSNSTITSIIAEDMKSKVLKIQNCSYLNNLSLSGTISNEVTVGYDKSINFEKLNSRKMLFTTLADDIDITLKQNSLLEELTLNGYRNIYLQDCPNLNQVIINNPSKVKKITISKCSNLTSKATKLSIISKGGEIQEGVIDLSGCTNLEEIDFSGGGSNSEATRYFTKIILPDGCKLANSCFYGSYQLKEISSEGTVYITGPNTFRWTAIEEIDCVNVDPSTTDLSYTFYVWSGGTANLTLTSIKNFIDRIPSQNIITNVSYMFTNQNKIEYGITSNNGSEYRSNKCGINLSKFTKVTNASYMFAKTKVIFFNKNIFKNFGVVDNVNFSGIFGQINGGTLYCTVDSLQYLMERIQNNVNLQITFLPQVTQTYINLASHNCKIQLVSVNSNGTITTINTNSGNITNFFSYNRQKIIGLYCFNFTSSNYNINYLFANDSGVPLFENLECIYYCFNNISIDDTSNLGLKYLPKLKYIYSSFQNISSINYIDLINLINWQKFKLTSTYTPSLSSYGGTNCTLFDCFTPDENTKKQVTKENYDKILNYINGSNNTILGNIFQDTLIISDSNEALIPNRYDGEDIYLDGNDNPQQVLLSNCYELNNTFNGVRIVSQDVYHNMSLQDYQDENTTPINIDNIVNSFKNCVRFIGTFANTILYRSLPYNFFKRRKQNISNVYEAVLTNGEYSIGERNRKYYYYTYTQDITDLSKCFYKSKISRKINEIYINYFDPVNEHNSEIEDNKLTDLSGNVVNEDYYFSSATSSYKQQITHRTEITDVQGVTISYITGNITVGFNNNSGNNQNTYGSSNYEETLEQNEIFGDLQDGDYTNLFFVAPDILYGCTSTCNITSCFEECNFSGALTKNLIKHMSNPGLYNWIKNVDILPSYVGTYYYQKGEVLLNKKVYSFVPEGFTKITEFASNTDASKRRDYSFNFYTRVPSQYVESSANDDIISYYIFLDTSFDANVKKLQNCLPSPPRTWETNQTNPVSGRIRYMWYLVNRGDIYYNIMFNTKAVTQDNYAGPDGFTLNNDTDIIGLFNWTYMGLGSGNLFKQETPLTSIRYTGKTNSSPAIDIQGISTNIIFQRPCKDINSYASLNSYFKIESVTYNPIKLSRSKIKGNSADNNIKDLYSNVSGISIIN